MIHWIASVPVKAWFTIIFIGVILTLSAAIVSPIKDRFKAAREKRLDEEFFNKARTR
jgi:hypothetical protein